ncbi:MAG: 30S ribosomal protein S20 [Flavobacteriales bacterium]
MANHRSTLRRIRSNERKRQKNHYYHKTARTFIKRLRNTKDKKEAQERLPKVTSMIDRLVRRKVIHKNKAANLKASLQRHVNQLS